MKKKLTFIALLTALMAIIFSVTLMGAFAPEGDEPTTPPATPDGYSLTVPALDSNKTLKLTQGQKTTLAYVLSNKKGNSTVTVDTYFDAEGGFSYQPIVKMFLVDKDTQAESEVEWMKNGTIDASDKSKVAVGDYKVKLTVADRNGENGGELVFTLTIAKAKKNYSTYIMLAVAAVLLIGIFVYSSYSNKKKQKKAQAAVQKLEIGDKVKTIGGICGYVVEINDEENTFVLETGTDYSKTYTKFDKAAIYQTAKPGEDTPDEKAMKQAEEEKAAKEAKKKAKEEAKAEKEDAFDEKAEEKEEDAETEEDKDSDEE